MWVGTAQLRLSSAQEEVEKYMYTAMWKHKTQTFN